MTSVSLQSQLNWRRQCQRILVLESLFSAAIRARRIGTLSHHREIARTLTCSTCPYKSWAKLAQTMQSILVIRSTESPVIQESAKPSINKSTRTSRPRSLANRILLWVDPSMRWVQSWSRIVPTFPQWATIGISRITPPCWPTTRHRSRWLSSKNSESRQSISQGL